MRIEPQTTFLLAASVDSCSASASNTPKESALPVRPEADFHNISIVRQFAFDDSTFARFVGCIAVPRTAALQVAGERLRHHRCRYSDFPGAVVAFLTGATDTAAGA